MYNSITEEIIRRAPQIDGSETDHLPQYLTKVYARIVSVRRRLNGRIKITKQLKKDISELRKLANNLESLTVLNRNNGNHVSAAFVAGTAHHLLQLIREQENEGPVNTLEAQSVPSWISSILLFLIGESPADASEIASKKKISTGERVTDQLGDVVSFLAMGQLGRIRTVLPVSKVYEAGEDEREAEDYLWLRLLLGLQQMAEVLLGNDSIKHDYFGEVSQLSIYDDLHVEGVTQSCYAGPYHLSLLLDILQDRLLSRGVVNVGPPDGIDAEEWFAFLRDLASTRPYLWENHFDAIQTGFLSPGNSAVLTFPTGAGKTTVAELKIAATIMTGRSVLYLVPTHALEDQINRDLKQLFTSMNGDLLEIGGEYTEIDEGSLATINVMTPERCLTLLSMNPEIFHEIGLVVFDEFHMMNGREDRIDKRSLDAMYCLLQLFTEIPQSDYLLISAMVENAEEIAGWIANVTGRNCEAFNSNWKPTRQLQGCVVYPSEEIGTLMDKVRNAHMEKRKGGPPVTLKRELKATPYQIFSLRNIWDSTRPKDFFIRKLFSKEVEISIGTNWRLTSNRNKVAAELAAFFVNSGIKTLVFVDNPVYAKSTARNLNALLNERTIDSESFQTQNSKRIASLVLELGDLKYSYFSLEKQVAAHHGLLLPVERQLNESLFKAKDGIHAIVATATLAQGINLPAEVVIIAGDDRFDEDTDAREILQAHEILNAAGRAGRAGTAAQGVVLIVPGKVITFDDKETAPIEWVDLQKKIFSKSDQCLEVNDPLSKFLDEVTGSDVEEILPQNLNSLLLRLHNDEASSTSIKTVFNNSFAAYKANVKKDMTFSKKVETLIKRRENLALELLYTKWVEVVSLKTGIDPNIIQHLGQTLSKEDIEGLFGYSLKDWIHWFLKWLEGSQDRIVGIFPGVSAQAQLARAIGLPVTSYNLGDVARNILSIEPILFAYIQGENYERINELVPGGKDEFLTKARHFVLRLIPQISFAIGVVSLTLKEMYEFDGNDPNDIPLMIRHLATMVREGLDSEEKLQYKLDRRSNLRVQVHDAFDV